MNEIQIQEISEKVKESGVTSVNNFLNPAQFEIANNILKNFHSNQYKKGDSKGYFPVNLKSIIIKLLKHKPICYLKRMSRHLY